MRFSRVCSRRQSNSCAWRLQFCVRLFPLQPQALIGCDDSVTDGADPNSRRSITVLERSERRHGPREIGTELHGRELQTCIERSEFGKLGTRLVEPHLVNQLLEDE